MREIASFMNQRRLVIVGQIFAPRMKNSILFKTESYIESIFWILVQSMTKTNITVEEAYQAALQFFNSGRMAAANDIAVKILQEYLHL